MHAVLMKTGYNWNNTTTQVGPRYFFRGIVSIFPLFDAPEYSRVCTSTDDIQNKISDSPTAISSTTYPDFESTSDIMLLKSIKCLNHPVSKKADDWCESLMFSGKALRPSSDQTHAKCTKKDQNASNHSLLSPEHFPTLVAEEILRHQFDQRCEDQ